MSENIEEMVEAVKYTLENTPPELAADIMETGIMLTGGGALIKGLDRLITETTGIPCHVAEYPLDCVAVGTGRMLDNIKTVSYTHLYEDVKNVGNIRNLYCYILLGKKIDKKRAENNFKFSLKFIKKHC